MKMKKAMMAVVSVFLMTAVLPAQGNESNKFDPIIKKIKEAGELLKKNLSVSKEQKEEAKKLFKENYGLDADSLQGSESWSRGGGDLPTLRKRINTSDEALIKTLADRMKTVQKIGALKKEQGMSSLQKKRWNEVLQRATELGAQQGLSKEFVKKIMNAIHEESLRIQKKP